MPSPSPVFFFFFFFFPLSLLCAAVAHHVPWAGNASCVCGGLYHSCLVSGVGHTVCWGHGAFGRLGYGSQTPYLSPSAALAVNPGGVQITQFNNVSVLKIACGWESTMALLTNGEARGWGRNIVGQLGLGHTQDVGDNELPWQLPWGGAATIAGLAQDVCAGPIHGCVVLAPPNVGKAQCFGSGANGRIGYGNVNNIGDNEFVSSAGFVDVGGTGVIVAIFCGGAHNLVLMNDGALRAWGGNGESVSGTFFACAAHTFFFAGYGQLGLGHTADIGDNELPSSQSNIALGLGGDPIDAVSLGEWHSCVLSLGRGKCWGRSDFGQTGSGGTSNLNNPSLLPFIDFGAGAYVVQLEGYSHHSCAVRVNGTVQCFGWAASGRLGCGWACGDQLAPNSTVALSGPVTRLSVGSYAEHTLAVHPDGSFQAWGRGDFGQLGYGDTEYVGDDETPASVGNVNFPDGVRCAEPQFATLTAPSLTQASATATREHGHRVPWVSNASCVCAGAYHSCANSGVGETVCWGASSFGQLGYGSTTQYLSPSAALGAHAGGVQVTQSGSVAVVKLACGWEQTIALLANSEVRGWGRNTDGRLGLGHTQDVGDNEKPWESPGGRATIDGTALDMCAGPIHTCVLLAAPSLGKVQCFGTGANGRLGYGNVNNIGDDELVSSAGFVEVGGSGVVVAIFCGGAHTFVLMNEGALRAWGDNAHGQLGLGFTGGYIGDNEHPSTRASIVLGLGGDPIDAVSLGEWHSCVLSLGRGKCWGRSDFGQTGSGGTSTLGDPSVLPFIDFGMGAYVVQLEAFQAHTCGVLLTGETLCFGLAGNGRLGFGFATANRLAPNETAALGGPVTRLAVGSYTSHTLAVHPNGSFQAWGYGGYGQLGYGDTESVGDDETPASVGNVNFPDGVSCVVPLFGTLTAPSATQPSHTEPTLTVTQPSVTATQPSVTATQPSVTATQTQPSVTATQPSLTASKRSDTATLPSITATQPSDTATLPSDTATQPSDSATASEATLTGSKTGTRTEITQTQPSDSATQPSDTETQRSVTATQSDTATQASLSATQASLSAMRASDTATHETVSKTEVTLSATVAMASSASNEPAGSNTALVVVVVVVVISCMLLLLLCGAVGAFVVRRRRKKSSWMEPQVEDAADAAASGGEKEAKPEVDAFELAPLKKRGRKEIGDGRYYVLSKVTRGEAAAIAKATGLVVLFAPGARKTKHVIGRGNFGSIKIGQRVEDGEFVAVKKVKGAANVKESNAEAQMQLAAAGANVLPIYNTVELRDSETEEPLLYHFLPLAGLGNGRHVQALLQACGDADLCERALIFVAKDLLLALRTMHGRGVCHLDVKLENVVWKIDGTGFVTDFGCARKSPLGRVPGDAIGDNRYFAPERYAAALQKGTFDGIAADVWAAGVTLLEMVSGKEVLEVLGLPADTQTRFERGSSPAFLEKQLAKVPELQRKSSAGSLLGVLRAMLTPRVEERVSVADALESACFGVVDAKEQWIAHEERRERGAVFRALQNPSSARKAAAAAHYSRMRETAATADADAEASSSEEEEEEEEEEEAYQKTPVAVTPYVHAAHRQFYNLSPVV